MPGSLQVRPWIGWLALAGFAVIWAAGAAEVFSPRIGLQVEQPAFAGLPVWLDVDVADACLEARYQGDVTAGVAPSWGFEPFSERAEVTDPNGRPAAAGFSAFVRPHLRFPKERHACFGSRPKGPASAHRFPLHIAADFRQPGDYKVRWIIPASDGYGVLAQSAWLAFTVAPSTASQREAWLQSMLSHVPRDPDEIGKVYIPSLLASSGDPRVTHRLLDFMCSPDSRISNFTFDVFTFAFDQDGQDYLERLAAQGCATDAFLSYLANHGAGAQPMRAALTHIAARRLKIADVDGAVRLIDMMLWLENGEQDALAGEADEAVLRAAPAIVASADVTVKRRLIQYLTYHGNTPGLDAVLRTLAMQPNRAAEDALTALAKSGDPADLSAIVARLSGNLDGLVRPNLMGLVEDLATNSGSGPARLQALRTLLTDAQVSTVRAAAAGKLSQLGDKAGMRALIRLMRDGDAEDVGIILDSLIGSAVPCRQDRASCFQTAHDPDPEGQWRAGRKAAVIAYYEAKLAE